MTAIVFAPWKGEKFGDAASDVRLLLLGESHYGDPDEDRSNATSSVVEKWRSGEWSVRYLTAAARLLTGKENWEIDRANDLSAIAFYNLVQIEMPLCGVRPTCEQARDSQAAFREALDLLAPTHILATGKFVWENLPEFDGESGWFEVGETVHEIGEYETSRGVALATFIPHLSRYFSPPAWRQMVQQFISLHNVPRA